MKRGLKSLKLINSFLSRNQQKKFKFNIVWKWFLADENAYILVNLRDYCYTYTSESIDYTIEHSDDYKWFKLDIMK